MFDKELPSRLNCGQSMAAAFKSVGPLTVPQLRVNEAADATLLNMRIDDSAKQCVANRFIGASWRLLRFPLGELPKVQQETGPRVVNQRRNP